MGECIITRRGTTKIKTLPVLNNSYPQDVNLITINDEIKTATFYVEIATPGVPASYTYQWYIDDVPIDGATSNTYTKTNLTTSGTWRIFCRITNNAGVVWSRAATLTVTNYRTPVLNPNYPADITQVEKANGSATFNVQIATEGVPANYTYQWFIDDVAIEGATSNTYTKTNLITSGTWHIFCRVTNTAGVVWSRAATLTVTSYKPSFTYSGIHELIDDGNNNWRVKFLTSGTVNFTNFGTGNGNIDIFCVGGGGGGNLGGGSGGYTKTVVAQQLSLGQDYVIIVGAGGAGKPNSAGGGASSFSTLASANGGLCNSNAHLGSDGGSGGGGEGNLRRSGNGGSNGSNGYSSQDQTYNEYEGWHWVNAYSGGTGQGATTKEFGEDVGTLYAGGGGGGSEPSNTTNSGAANIGGYGGAGGGGNGACAGYNTNTQAQNGGTNTGGGGGGGNYQAAYNGGSGGSGIVIIRNHR